MTRTSRIFIFLSAILCPFICNGQEETDSISIEECMRLARENYPQIKQLNLIEEAAKYDISGAMKSWLPRLNISGKATYQSDVVEMPFDIPGFSFNLPHDQYSLVGARSARPSGTEAPPEARKRYIPPGQRSRRNRWKSRCIPSTTGLPKSTSASC